MKYSSLRIEIATLERLQGYRERLERSLPREGDVRAGRGRRPRLSLSDAVDSLLTAQERHSQRRDRSRVNRAGDQPADTVESPASEDGTDVGTA